MNHFEYSLNCRDLVHIIHFYSYMRVLLKATKRKNLTSLFGLIRVDSFSRSVPFYTFFFLQNEN